MTPPKALVPAAVLVWSGLAAAVLLARQDEPALAKAEPAHPFEARWDDATSVSQERTGDDQPLLKKQDRLPLAMTADVAVTERITPPAPDAQVSVPPVILVQDDDDKSPASRHRRHRNSEPGHRNSEPAHSHSESNVCTRHKMRKVTIRKSWRCRK